jgi:hypothetical protein
MLKYTKFPFTFGCFFKSFILFHPEMNGFHECQKGYTLPSGRFRAGAAAAAFPPPGISAPASGQTDDVYSRKHRDPLLQPGTGRGRIKAVS